MGELYADNGNGRLAPATKVLYDGPAGVQMLSYVQSLVTDGLAFYVGDNAGGADQLFKLADLEEPAAMAIGTSANLGTVLNALAGGLVPDLAPEDVGVGPLPGPGPVPTALVGGAALYITDGRGDAEAAAAWDFEQYLVSADTQSLFATLTGYVPVRDDALETEPAASVYRDDPRFRVAYDQLIGSPDTPALQGPILGPQREIRAITARAVADIFTGGDVQTALSNAAAQANDVLAGVQRLELSRPPRRALVRHGTVAAMDAELAGRVITPQGVLLGTRPRRRSHRVDRRGRARRRRARPVGRSRLHRPPDQRHRRHRSRGRARTHGRGRGTAARRGHHRVPAHDRHRPE